MNSHFTYLLVDLLSFIFPFIFSFHPAFSLKNQWRAVVLSIFIPALFFIAWDILFTFWQVWWFNMDYTIQLTIFNLPLEEIMFFICIPFACLFTYNCVKLYLPNFSSRWFKNIYALVLATLLLITAIVYLNNLYTSVTFILLAVYIIILIFSGAKFLGRFLFSFVLILPFFFVTNGILTGSFIEQPVVNYNPLHNMGIRLFTIPLEDVFYGMLLLLLNVTCFELFGSTKKAET